ncbi:sulfite reductase (ferredoxin) [Catalinimonas alkaloidigena]|uniref:Sulfite reductase (Ferredoxin) n=1 Tax=Catalinimonas alkaloidigena TaxID=1075417 RepID=A0A1G9Q139_9BACT|nr:nitrite/sulfite reductase [Catalinimonas alkaloidigena]SDM04706.1 sulfite reductase (ferredoxin) [Catalinimonas alkaloidigena]
MELDHISSADRTDILELQEKIDAFQHGQIPEDKFKAYRLTRGVYGQRQLGVQMFRTKLPYGRITSHQLTRLADISEHYTNGNLHLTTRQNIQLHFVKLTDSPAIWKELAEVGVTAREACGNTVRNFTASAHAGIDPEEAFDVSPYVEASFRYFLRNPICQDMGRKIKIAFSSSEADSAFTYFHDFGFIPRVKHVGDREIRGFKVVIGGGLGAQAIMAQTAYEFLEEDQIIPLMEAGLRVFDRYGERAKRHKARMKFLIKDIGLERFLELVEEQKPSLKHKSYKIDRQLVPTALPAQRQAIPEVAIADEQKYQQWLESNVYRQKQAGFYGIQLRVPLGNVSAEQARTLAKLVKNYAADDIRITINQGLLLRFVRPEALAYVYSELDKLGFADPGFDTLVDVTACPGTDTCNLAVTNSTGLTVELEKVIRQEYPELVGEPNLHIKISGCMNSCGQHMAANIGFHGSSIKKGGLVAPAMQVVLGGGVDPQGRGFIAEKIVKVPTKRIPEVIRRLLDGFQEDRQGGEYFNDYFQRLGKMHFYHLLKPLAELDVQDEEAFRDWGEEALFQPEIGTGECAGISYDVVGGILGDAEEKLVRAEKTLAEQSWAEALYYAYTSLVIGAKGLLLAKDVSCNTQKGILQDFDAHYVQQGEFVLPGSASNFEAFAERISQHEPEEAFARQYVSDARAFLEHTQEVRQRQLDKTVINHYYKA